MESEQVLLTAFHAELLRPGPTGPTLERRVALSEMLDAFAGAVRQAGFETPLLPAGVRMWRQAGGHTVVVFEQPPQVRRVHWVNDGERPDLDYDAYIERTLAFPYTVFVFSFDGGVADGHQQLYYRTAPLKDMDDPLLMPNLLNVTIGGDAPVCWACLGKLPEGLATWDQRVSAAVGGFWSAGFNHDFDVPRGACFTRLTGLDPRIASVDAWERASRADPLFPLGIPWPDTGVTLAGAVEAAAGNRDPVPVPATLGDLGDLLYRVPEAG